MSLNNPLLWRGQINRYNNGSIILPKSYYIPERPSIHDELNYRYSQYSKKYWENVKKRQEEYRSSNRLS